MQSIIIPLDEYNKLTKKGYTEELKKQVSVLEYEKAQLYDLLKTETSKNFDRNCVSGSYKYKLELIPKWIRNLFGAWGVNMKNNQEKFIVIFTGRAITEEEKQIMRNFSELINKHDVEMKTIKGYKKWKRINAKSKNLLLFLLET